MSPTLVWHRNRALILLVWPRKLRDKSCLNLALWLISVIEINKLTSERNNDIANINKIKNIDNISTQNLFSDVDMIYLTLVELQAHTLIRNSNLDQSLWHKSELKRPDRFLVNIGWIQAWFQLNFEKLAKYYGVWLKGGSKVSELPQKVP